MTTTRHAKRQSSNLAGSSERADHAIGAHRRRHPGEIDEASPHGASSCLHASARPDGSNWNANRRPSGRPVLTIGATNGPKQTNGAGPLELELDSSSPLVPLSPPRPPSPPRLASSSTSIRKPANRLRRRRRRQIKLSLCIGCAAPLASRLECTGRKRRPARLLRLICAARLTRRRPPWRTGGRLH